MNWQSSSGTCSLSNLTGPDAASLTVGTQIVGGDVFCFVNGWANASVWAVSQLDSISGNSINNPIPFESNCSDGQCTWRFADDTAINPPPILSVAFDFIAMPQT